MKGLISSFVDVSASDSVHEEAVAGVLSVLSQGQSGGLTQVVEGLEEALVHPSGATRARGVLLLALLLQRLSLGLVSAHEASFLLVFLRDRSRDSPCVPEVLAALTALVQRWSSAVAAPALEATLVTLFAELFVQGLDQPTRHAAFRFMEAVITNVPEAAVAMNHDFVFGYLQMIDGERDPRNLLLIFSLTPRVLSIVSGWENRLAEELFDVCACYYPINYKPRGENDPITAGMLVDALDKVMTCVPQFAQYYYPFMMEKLEGERGHLWSSLARSIVAFGDGGKSFLPHAFVFWGAIQADAFEGKDAATVQGACVAMTKILEALSENLVTQNSGACSLDPLLDPLVRVCSAKLQDSDSKDALVGGALLTASARASAEAARRVCVMAVPTLSRLTVDAPSESVKEKMAGLLSDLVGAVVEVGVELPKKAHPLFPHVQGLQTVALELCQHPTARVLRETGLSMLCNLCFRTPLAAVEAQTVALSRVFDQGADATLAAVAGMSTAMQTELALPKLVAQLPPSDGALGGLCALRPSVTVPTETSDPLFKSLLAMRDSQLSAAVLGNMANKGQASSAIVASWLSLQLSAVQIAWLGRGLVLSGDVLARKLLDEIVARCESEHDAALILETVFGTGLEALSSTSSHAVERPLGRQKAFCQLFPALVERSNLHAVGVLAGVVPAAVILGELPQLLPLLLGKVKSGSEDRGGLQGALMALSAIVKEASDEISLHTDTLLKQAAGHCAHSDEGVRKAALSFLLACASSLPFPRLFGWKEEILSKVSLALDDPKRHVRRLAVTVASKYNTLG